MIHHPMRLARGLAVSLAITAVFLPDTASGQPGVGLGLEARGGAAIGAYGPTAAAIHLAPGPSIGMSADWTLAPALAIYGGVSRVAFGCDEGFCRESDVSFHSIGAETGVRLATSFFWARAGGILHRLQSGWTGEEGPGSDQTGFGIGGDAAVGFAIPVGSALSLTPGVRYGRYTAPGDEGKAERTAFVTAEIGMRWRR